MAADDTKLQIGDEFALQTIPAGEAGVDPVVGFVAASKSGGLDGSCFVDFLDGSDMEHANSPMPHNCRFKLHTTNQYAAWRRLFKFRNAASGLEPDPELEAQLLAEVQAEAKVNTTEFALRTGHVVRFGQVLQILSPVADAYLCTSKLIAEEDTSSLRCSLLPRDERSKQVWFRILPGYRTRNEGEPVSMGDTIILQSIKAEHMYLSCRHKGAPPLSRREVHISTTYTRFRVVPVANFHDCGRGQQFVRGGDYVQIYHRQLQSYLHRDEQGRPRLLRPHRLQKADKARAVRADLVWQIESPCMKWGGSTLRASEKRAYSLKDTVSGHFLHELQDGSVSFEPGDDTNMAQWVLLPFDDEVDEMTVETAEFLLQNKGTGRVLHHIQESEATVEGGGALFSLRGTDENVENEDELFVFRTFTEEWLMQLRFVQEEMGQLQTFHSAMQIGSAYALLEGEDNPDAIVQTRKTQKPVEWDAAKEKTDLKKPCIHRQARVRMVLKKWLLPDPESLSVSSWTGTALVILEKFVLKLVTGSTEPDPLERIGAINYQLSSMLTEIRMAPFLLNLLNQLFQLFGKQAIAAQEHGPYVLRLVHYIFRLLYLLVKGNEINARIMSRAENFAILKDQIAMNFRATDTITQIFTTVPSLLADVDSTFMELIWRLAKQQQQADNLELLSVLVLDSVTAEPLKPNQDRVLSIIRSDPMPPGLFNREWYKVLTDSTAAQFQFHQEFVHLVAVLCSGRQTQAAQYFKEVFGFTYPTVLHVVLDSSASPSARIAYTRLLFTVFVDREPFEYHVTVQRHRILPTIQLESIVALSDHADRPEKTTPSLGGDFADLKAGIASVLRLAPDIDTSQPDYENQQYFISELCELARMLVLLGVYESSCFREVSDGVLQMGDESKHLAELLVPLLSAKGSASCTMKLKSQVLKLLDVLYQLQTSQRLTIVLREVCAPGNSEAQVTKAVRTTKKAKKAQSPGRSASTFDQDTKVYTNPVGDGADSPRSPTSSFEREGALRPQGVTTFDAELPEGGVVGTGLASGLASGTAAATTRPLAPTSTSGSSTGTALLDTAMQQANAVQLIGGEQQERLPDLLVGILKFAPEQDSHELCFDGFEMLLRFLTQDFSFGQLITQVTLLSTNSEAQIFLDAKQQIGELQRLLKLLHMADGCERCNVIINQLADMCVANGSEGQDLLRSLDLGRIVSSILARDENSDAFVQLTKSCLNLVSKFVNDNAQNQHEFSQFIEPVLVPMMWEHDSVHLVQAAGCVEQIVDRNEHLSVTYCSMLVQVVQELVKAHGPHVELLQLLESMVLCEGRPVLECQVKVCNAASSMSTKGLCFNVHGGLRKNIWGKGPGMRRVRTLCTALGVDLGTDKKSKSASQEDVVRARKAVKYYSRSLTVLAKTCKGKAPVTGLACAALLPFPDLMERLGELWGADCAELPQEQLSVVKEALVAFLIEVFMETSVAHCVRSVLRPANGIWTQEPTSKHGTEPLAASLLADLECLAQPATLPPPDSMQRAYLIERAAGFFVEYARHSGKEHAEATTIKEFMAWAQRLADAALALDDAAKWSERETQVLKMLSTLAAHYVAGRRVRNEMLRLGPATAAPQETHASAQQQRTEQSAELARWYDFVLSVVPSLQMGMLKGTGRAVGRGVIDAAKTLWRTDAQGQHYTALLVKPLRTSIKLLNEKTSQEEEIPILLQVLDTVRAVLYAISSHTPEEADDAFLRYVRVEDLNCMVSPEVALVQNVMVEEGWALLCFEILHDVDLRKLHLTALRLLLALTGGGNRHVQDKLLEQLMDQSGQCPVEIYASTFRRMLREGVNDLKDQRHGKGTKETGYALEVMRVIENCCMNHHKGMQDYQQSQPGHEDTFDLISEITRYLDHTERDLKETVRLFSAGVTLDAASKRMQDRAFTALRVLTVMGAGPHVVNQVTIVHTDILSIMNRMSAYTSYTSIADLGYTESDLSTRKSGKAAPTTDGSASPRSPRSSRTPRHDGSVQWNLDEDSPKRTLNVLISGLLMALLQGKFPVSVAKRIVNALDWNRWAEHMEQLQAIMDPDHPKHGVGWDDEADRPFQIPKQAVKASWVKKESHEYMTVVAKLQVTDVELEPMAVVLLNDSMISFFTERLGEVEVFRDAKLERAFFHLPQFMLLEDEWQDAEDLILAEMDKAPRDNANEKLRSFAESMLELVSTIDLRDSTQGVQVSPFVTRYFAWAQKWKPVLTVSAILAGICILAFEKQSSRSSMSKDTFSRWENDHMYYMFVLGATVHLLFTMVQFYAFMLIRVPVIREKERRGIRLQHFLRQQGAKVKRRDRDVYLEKTAYVYGLAHEICAERLLRKVFGKFGVITVVYSVKVAGANNSWALITFADIASVSKILRAAKHCNYANFDKQSSVTHKTMNVSVDEKYVGDEIEVDDAVKEQEEEEDHRVFNLFKDVGDVIFGETLMGLLPVGLLGLSSTVQTTLFVRALSAPELDASVALAGAAEESVLALISRDTSVGFLIATKLQHLANMLPCGRLLPIESCYVMRANPEAWSAVLDIAMSVLGCFYSPLLFGYHMTKLTELPAADIVIKSISTNWARLATTFILSLLMMYFFSILALLYFDFYHQDKYVSNENGPCANLLTCFVSYSFAGLMQDGLSPWMVSPAFPETSSSLWSRDLGRIGFEISFMMVTTSFALAIITGIICDTFGELRLAQDDALIYRSSHTFVTGIPYVRVPAQKSTSHMQYLMLLLYLRITPASQLTPLQRHVRYQIEHGEIDWLPSGTCFALETQVEGQSSVETRIANIEERLGSMDHKLSNVTRAVEQLVDKGTPTPTPANRFTNAVAAVIGA